MTVYLTAEPNCNVFHAIATCDVFMLAPFGVVCTGQFVLLVGHSALTHIRLDFVMLCVLARGIESCRTMSKPAGFLWRAVDAV